MNRPKISLALSLLVMLAASATSCTPADAVRWKEAGRCAGIAAVRQVFGAAMNIIGNTPNDTASWSAFGENLGRRYGSDVLGCAAELVAGTPVAAEEVAMGPAPRPIGFALPGRAAAATTAPHASTGPGAGDPSAGGGQPAATGSVTSTDTSLPAVVPRHARDFAAGLLVQ